MNAVIDFVIFTSEKRIQKHGANFSNECFESVQIFDELDSLTQEELSFIYSVFLLGSSSPTKTTKLPENQDLAEWLASNSELGASLKKGKKLCKEANQG